MISDHSFVSSVSQSTAHFSSSNLKQIESSVFTKIINLKSQKIELMSHLSKTMDQKYRAEDQLLQAVHQKKKEEQKLVQRRVYEPIVRKYYSLKDESDELQRQIKQRPISTSEQDHYMIQQIQELRQENSKLQLLMSENFPIQKTIKQLHQRMSILGQILSNKEPADSEGEQANQGRQKIQQLRAYIEEQEYNKKMLYDQILEFTQQIESVRKQNQMLRQNCTDSN